MFAALSLIVVIVVSLLVVRVATVALVQTGISRDLARFQARSAFTGSGYTTAEAEKIVTHPVRRRIIMLLMLLGNAGLVTAASSLFLSFANASPEGGITSQVWFRILVIVVLLGVVWMLAHSQWVDHQLSRAITLALKRWTDLEIRDYAGLLHLTGGYAVHELKVAEDDWLAEKSLAKLRLDREGVLILGIERGDGRYVGVPNGETMIHADDLLLLYGRTGTLVDLDTRKADPMGGRRHIEAVAEQEAVEREEQAEDQIAEAERTSEDAETEQDEARAEMERRAAKRKKKRAERLRERAAERYSDDGAHQEREKWGQD